MLGMSPWMWVWMGALAPGLWFVRAVIGAFLVGRITRTVVEKADVKDLPEVLTGLGVLAGVLSASSRPVPRTTMSTPAAAIDVEVREGGRARLSLLAESVGPGCR